MCNGDEMRSGLPYLKASHGRVDPGRFKFDTEKPVKPAFGFPPMPVAPSSRISPPLPVDAPGKGAIAVG